MKLMTNELRKKLPPLGATDGTDGQCLVKYFTPDSNWTWFVQEFDGSDLFFGAVAGMEFELGYFRLSELEETTGPLGLHIERDLYFKPTPLSEIRKQYDRHG
ncbi:hypothetical protein ANRL1_04254 [Anaerolineae bacterium]|nr:hypothetical protein ANRL1_04254 [Anaerolineae bacterium]